MPRKKTTSTALVPVPPPTFYPIGEAVIEPTQLILAGRRHPRGDGPWKREADKIAWIDEATGLACTILRQATGTLSGYVGLAPEHPLFGFAFDAVPAALGISVHGGLSYAKMCDESGPEEVRVCHPSESRGDPLWWFGFSCDRSYDYVPGSGHKDLAEENGQTYKSEGYVYRETVRLARQLKAVGEDSTSGVPLDLSAAPPLGLDPEERR